MVDLGVVVSERQGWTLVALSGELDMASVPELRERLHGLLARGPNLVVDLDDVGLLDSSGLGVLVGTMRRARTAGGDLRLVCAQPRLVKLLEITGLDRAFATFATVDEAIG